MTTDPVTAEWVRNAADEKAAAAGMRFDAERGKWACDWIENYCCLYEGSAAGQPLRLMPYQREFVMRLFGWVRWSAEWGEWVRRFTAASLWCSKKNGKALCLETEVPTPGGFRRFGDLEVGDRLYDETGSVCRVVARTEVMNDRPCFEVEFSDGAKVVADAEHLWAVESFQNQYRSRVLTTREIAATVDVVNGRGQAWAKNHRIPVAGPVTAEDADVSIPPYTLGAWLGDGDSDCNRITTADDEVLVGVASEGESVGPAAGRRGKARRYRIGGTYRGDRSGKALISRLRAAGLLGNKHIPDAYLFGSVPQRMSLLCGLMDTDGTVSKAGQCSYTSTNPQLAADVRTLIASLGWKPTTNTKIARCQNGAAALAYQIQFWATPDRPCFTIKRKLERLREARAERTRAMTRHIVAVRPVDSAPVRCIEVDSPSRLFLVTRSFVPTHNSPILAALGLYLMCGDGEPGQKVYTAAKNGDQAKISQRHAFAMVEQSPQLSADCKLNRSTLQVTHLPSKSVMMILTGDDSRGAKAKEGLNGSVLIDECHVFDREMHERTSRAGISRKEPLNLAVSTAGDDPSSYGHERFQYGRQVNEGKRLDPHFLHAEYGSPAENPTEAEIDARLVEFGKAANPAWGHIVRETEFRADWQRSKGNPREVARFKQYRLNLWVGSTNPWLDVAGWESGAREFAADDLRGRECYLGLDLSRTRDMTACVALFPWDEDGPEVVRVWPLFWLPEKTARDRDHLFPFRSWAEAGHVALTSGDVVDYAIVENDICEFVESHDLRVLGLYFDQHYAEEITQRLAERLACERTAVAQSLMTLSPLSKEFERRVSTGKVHHAGNAVMTWQVGHVEVWADRNQNVRPVKPNAATGKSIDGIMALLDAMTGVVSGAGVGTEPTITFI